MTRNLEAMPEGNGMPGEIDLRVLAAALRRRLRLLVGVALAACLLITVVVNVIAPRYTAQSQVLLENQETFFTRPDRVNVQPYEQASTLDPEAVASQVQLITSRDIARRAIKELKLEGNEEFDPQAGLLEPFKRVLVLVGLLPDTTQESRDSRIVTNFLDKLVVYSPPKTRVVVVDFTSRDPELAARAANTVVALYLQEQSAAKRQTARQAAESLAEQIADLRARLVKADDAREQYRLQTGLLAGTNNMTISGQQLADINTDLSKARTAQADAQAKAQMIRDLLRRGAAADVPDVINNDTVRRIAEQRVTVVGQLALESRTLLPGHPRIKALQAQVQEYDYALKAAAKQAATTLENEATIAGSRVKNLETVLSQQKALAGTANVDEVHLHTLERAANDLKDQLESSTTKYQEALARASSDATPADARVIQRAVAPQEPSFPKKLPFIVFGTIAALALTIGFVVAGELMSAPAVAPQQARDDEAPAPARPTAPAPSRAIVWGRMMPERARSAGGVAGRARPAAPGTEDDVVFAPAAATTRKAKRPSVVRLMQLAEGSLLGSLVERVRRFGSPAATAHPAPTDEGENELAPHDAHREAIDDALVGWDETPDRPEPRREEVVEEQAADDRGALVERIVEAHVPGHGLHVVGVGVATESVAPILDLARSLSAKGRSIIVDLDRSPAKLAPLARPGETGTSEIAAMVGLAELLAGDSSFAEVIHRDHASRLHFVPTGRREADFRDFDLILDALSATYDFIVLLAPAFPQSEVAKIMAPYADFMVLAAGAEADPALLADVEREVRAAGAREVLVAGRSTASARRDVA